MIQGTVFFIGILIYFQKERSVPRILPSSQIYFPIPQENDTIHRANAQPILGREYRIPKREGSHRARYIRGRHLLGFRRGRGTRLVRSPQFSPNNNRFSMGQFRIDVKKVFNESQKNGCRCIERWFKLDSTSESSKNMKKGITNAGYNYKKAKITGSVKLRFIAF